MRLISIEKNTGTSVVINTTNLCSIYEDAGTVLIRMACGHAIATKFTDVTPNLLDDLLTHHLPSSQHIDPPQDLSQEQFK